MALRRNGNCRIGRVGNLTCRESGGLQFCRISGVNFHFLKGIRSTKLIEPLLPFLI